MKLPRDLSGHDLAAGLCIHWGYEKVNQAGSHIILQTREPTPHRIAVPAHKAVRVGARGTCGSSDIFRVLSRGTTCGSRSAMSSRIRVAPI